MVAYSFVFEKWTILDSLYFTTALLTTVGYGDMTPSTSFGKLFATVFALIGIVVLGLALGVIGSEIVEAELNLQDEIKVSRVFGLPLTLSGSSSRITPLHVRRRPRKQLSERSVLTMKLHRLLSVD